MAKDAVVHRPLLKQEGNLSHPWIAAELRQFEGYSPRMRRPILPDHVHGERRREAARQLNAQSISGPARED